MGLQVFSELLVYKRVGNPIASDVEESLLVGTKFTMTYN